MLQNEATPNDILRIAADADVDPRTVRRLLGGGVLRPRTRARILRALRAHGLFHLLAGAE